MINATRASHKILAILIASILAVGFLPAFATGARADELTKASASAEDITSNKTRAFTTNEQANGSADVSAIVAGMTLDEKISQMIIPAIRSWDGTNVTDLSTVPSLAEALRAHQYGGVILFGQNVVNTEQTARLVSALQANNAQIPASTNIPYFTPVDEEGGAVLRLSMGTRMTGNMAVGATGAHAVENARITGQVLGEECAALGFNVDYAPDVDVNNNPANPVIGTRSFSDDPALVGQLGAAYAEGLGASNVIATFKHFPGHGDTGVDSHIGTPSVNKSYDELKACELVPFAQVIDAGADMIMTAHITFPAIDDQQVYGDGVTRGYYPATMSHKMITDVLRTDMGFDGVVVTDALEMDAIHKAKLVPGEEGSVEYGANIAEKVINAGVDILLIPTDLKTADAATFYDNYIAALISKVESGVISQNRIDESVTRILNLKNKYGILDTDAPGASIDQVVEAAKQIVGSDAHHASEEAIAKQAITLVKNEDAALPLSGYDSKIVILGREAADNVGIAHAISQLQQTGVVDPNAYVNNVATGQTSGSPDASTSITIGYYYDVSTGQVDYPEAVREAVLSADKVVCISKMYGLAAQQPTGVIYQGVSGVMADAQTAGAKFILLSGNLPYDAARYTNTDAVALAYMCAGAGIDPTDRSSSTGASGAYNANIIAAVEVLFDDMPPTGTLPVNIPAMATAEDGTVSYSDQVLYERGLGLGYQYQFTEGEGGSHEGGSSSALSFATNARRDMLSHLLVDGDVVDPANYVLSWGPTKIELSADYLNTLTAGNHVLSAVYDYGSGEFSVEAPFVTTEAPVVPPVPVDPDPETDPEQEQKPEQEQSPVPASKPTPTPTSDSSSASPSKAQASPSTPKANASANTARTTPSTASAASKAAQTQDSAPVTLLALVALVALACAGSAAAANRNHPTHHEEG